MDITIHNTFLPQNDPDAALAFYRDVLGFEVRNQVEYGGMHWNTVGPTGQPDVNIVLTPPGADPGVTDDERRTIAEMMAKGTYASIMLGTKDLDGTFERLQAGVIGVNTFVASTAETPFGGSKDSGFGREGGPTAIREYLDTKFINIALPEENQ